MSATATGSRAMRGSVTDSVRTRATSTLVSAGFCVLAAATVAVLLRGMTGISVTPMTRAIESLVEMELVHRHSRTRYFEVDHCFCNSTPVMRSMGALFALLVVELWKLG